MNSKPTSSSSSPLMALLETSTLPDLGPKSRAEAWSVGQIEEALKGNAGFGSLFRSRAEAVKSLILLWHDHLDASHEISQSLHDDTGSYIHGMMHRREPDYFNAKYWFRRVPNHPAFRDFPSTLKGIATENNSIESLTSSSAWNPFNFVDLCEKAAGQKDMALTQPLQEVQKLEFQTLLKWLLSQS